MLEHFLVRGQLGFDEIVQFMVVRAHRQLVHAQFVQTQQLHQHAVEVAKFMLHRSLLGTTAQFLGQALHPLVVGLDQRRQGILKVVHGGGDHRGKIKPLVILIHAPNTRMCSLR